MEILRRTPWSRIREQISVNKELWENVGNGKANGQCSKGDNCSFPHDLKKRARSKQPNPSPSSFMQQTERNVSRTRSPRGKESQWKNVSIALQGLPQRNLHQFILWKKASSRMLVLHVRKMVADLVKSAGMRIARLMNSLAKGLKRMVAKVQWLCWKLHDTWVAYSRIWSRRSLHRFCGRAQTYGNQSDAFDSQKPSYVMLTFDTKIHRLEWFAQVILNSVTPKLQNSRIGLRKWRNGKSDVPMKQRGGWPKVL